MYLYKGNVLLKNAELCSISVIFHYFDFKYIYPVLRLSLKFYFFLLNFFSIKLFDLNLQIAKLLKKKKKNKDFCFFFVTFLSHTERLFITLNLNFYTFSVDFILFFIIYYIFHKAFIKIFNSKKKNSIQ